jgi:propanol-preferring alcohol dehydrogenase
LKLQDTQLTCIRSGARPGQTVAIVGAGGGLGSLAQQYAKAMGLKTIAIDAGEEKEKMCKQLGSYAFVDFGKSKDVVKDVQAATEDGLGPHAVILLAVNEKPFQQAAEVRVKIDRTHLELTD